MRRALVAATAAVGLLVEPSITRSCGPDLPEAVFVSYGEPEPPLAEFAAGNLGVLHPSWRQKYLVIAFRRLRGLPLDTQQALLVLGAAPRDSVRPQSWSERWRAARNRVAGPPDPGMVFVENTMQIGDDYVFFTSCLDDAFRTAIATLEDRARRSASHREPVLNWVRAQDQVFANCRGDSKLPAPTPPGAPAWLAQDRAYQTAAALFFYANRFDDARAAFETIANDVASPWSAIAPYMVARTLTRQGTLTVGWREADAAKLEQADAACARVLADPRRREFHAAARRLQGFLRFRLHRAERLAELSRAVAAPRAGADYANDVQDLTLMLDHFSAAQVESLAALRDDYETADWVLSFQSGRLDHALARWRASHDAAWLVAAISRAHGRDAAAAELSRAAAEAKPSSAAFATLTYHRARLLEEMGRAEESRALLDHLLGSEARSWPRAAQNLLHARRLRLARNPAEVVTHAQRLPAAMGTDTQGIWPPADSERTRPLLDDDATWLFNRRVPIETLANLLKRPGLADTLRARLALALWTRAVLLERHDLGPGLAQMAAAGFPALRPGLSVYAQSRDGQQRDVAVTWLMLHAPGVNPWIRAGLGRTTPPEERDILHDNWWCRASEDRSQWPPTAGHAHDPVEAELYHDGWDRTVTDALVEPRLRGMAERERAELDSLGPAPNVLCRRVLAWTDRAPSDPRIPEALALAVRATRYGCADTTTTAWSRRAYDRLHRQFPRSEWTRKTPHWY